MWNEAPRGVRGDHVFAPDTAYTRGRTKCSNSKDIVICSGCYRSVPHMRRLPPRVTMFDGDGSSIVTNSGP